MISGIDLSSTVNYTLKGDTENPTIWKLGMIPSYLFAKISGQFKAQEVEAAYKVLQISLKGWENFNIPYETSKEKIFDKEFDVVPLAILERIPLTVITELTMKVLEINQIQEEERKN